MTFGRRLSQTDVTVYIDGVETAARAGESVAALLLATNRLIALYCGMGACHACVIEIDGVRGRRACVEPVVNGMRIELASGAS